MDGSSTTRTPSLRAAAGAALLSACAPLDNPYLAPPEPSFQDFSSRIQPILRQECAFAGCHGTFERALTLYAVDGLRAEPATPRTPLDPNELSEAELTWNYDALRYRLIDETDADRARLLLKCLDPAKGGIGHGDDIVVWTDRDDPDYQAVRDWIAGGLE